MKKEEVISKNADCEGTIQEHIDWLKRAQDAGATHFEVEWNKDPTWTFKWFRAYKLKTEDELKQEKIEKLQAEIEKLKS